MKKIISLILVFSLMLTFGINVFAENVNMIMLENGKEVTEEEFLEILYNYEGEIYELTSNLSDINNEIIDRHDKIQTMSLPFNDVLTIMAGTWYIPGIGKIIVAGGTVYLGTMAAVQLGSSLGQKVKAWLIDKAETKESEKRVDGVLKGKTKDRKTGGDTHVYEGSGGKRAADGDFNRLNQGKATTYSNGTKVGQLPDGTKINVRPGSSSISGNKPTLEIQGKGKHKIKIRY